MKILGRIVLFLIIFSTVILGQRENPWQITDTTINHDGSIRIDTVQLMGIKLEDRISMYDVVMDLGYLNDSTSYLLFHHLYKGSPVTDTIYLGSGTQIGGGGSGGLSVAFDTADFIVTNDTVRLNPNGFVYVDPVYFTVTNDTLTLTGGAFVYIDPAYFTVSNDTLTFVGTTSGFGAVDTNYFSITNDTLTFTGTTSGFGNIDPEYFSITNDTLTFVGTTSGFGAVDTNYFSITNDTLTLIGSLSGFSAVDTNYFAVENDTLKWVGGATNADTTTGIGNFGAYQLTSVNDVWTPLSGLTSTKLVQLVIDATNKTSGVINVITGGTTVWSVLDATSVVRTLSISDSLHVEGASVNLNYYLGDDANTILGLYGNSGVDKFWVVASISGQVMVKQYSLSTPGHISSASYNNISFNFSSIDNNTRDIALNSDGTKMWSVGTGTDSVYQYTLSNAWDISSSVKDNVSFYVGGQEVAPLGIEFNSAFTKMWISGSGGGTLGTIHQYTLSSAEDISSASYDSKVLNVDAIDESPSGMVINSTADTLWFMGAINRTIYQYIFGTSGDISTATYDSKSLYVGDRGSNLFGLIIGDNKLWVAASSTRYVYEYIISTARDISTATYSSESFSGTSNISINYN